jgi:hypothetical protein
MKTKTFSCKIEWGDVMETEKEKRNLAESMKNSLNKRKHRKFLRDKSLEEF